jgi:hypothetical protein
MDSLRNSLPVVIPAYQRPEKVIKRYAEIIEWSRLEKLYISVDAPRLKASETETLGNKSVLQVSQDLAEKDSRVELLVWNKNFGVNNLLANVIEATKQYCGLIVIEDDLAVTHQTLDFLADNYEKAGSKAATGHVRYSHLNLSPRISRISTFPLQWGVAFNSDVMSRYIDVHKNAKFERKIIQKVFYKHFKEYLSSLELEKLTQWWFNHFYFCYKHGNWADAILQYSVYASDGFYRAPATSLIQDDADFLDERSMNPRTKPHQIDYCDRGVIQGSSGDYFCLKCELESSHLHEAKLRNLIGATKHRRLTKTHNKFMRHKI